MTVTKALKKLYLTITGSASTKSSAAKVLSDLADNWTPGAAVPAVTPADNGKVMKVVNGVWDKGNDSGSVLPAVTAEDNGDVLAVVNGVWAKNVPVAELPEYSVEDAGKILTIQEDGTLAWVSPEAAE